VLRCQYHGWTYTLDGRLIGTPDVEGVEFFDRSTMGMTPLRVEVWEQFMFVNFDAQAEPRASYPGKIPEQARGFQFEGLQFAERRDYVMDCNWKVYVDNYLEGYHIPIAHPGLMQEIDYANYRTDTYRYYSQQFAPIRAIKTEERAERFYAPGSGVKQAVYFWIFPNLMVNIYPDNVSTNLIVPASHDKTLTIFEWFFHDVANSAVQERIQRAIAFSDQVQQEDIGLCENVQRGLRSSTYDRGRYSVKRENGVHHFLHAAGRVPRAHVVSVTPKINKPRIAGRRGTASPMDERVRVLARASRALEFLRQDFSGNRNLPWELGVHRVRS
jgi:choline monooxygenase